MKRLAALALIAAALLLPRLAAAPATPPAIPPAMAPACQRVATILDGQPAAAARLAALYGALADCLERTDGAGLANTADLAKLHAAAGRIACQGTGIDTDRDLVGLAAAIDDGLAARLQLERSDDGGWVVAPLDPAAAADAFDVLAGVAAAAR